MRQGEAFHSLRIPPECWAVVRVDGKGFSRFTESRFEKPFDARFHEMMVATATALLEGLNGIYGYTESDEISLLLPRNWELYDREVEKTVSIAAGMASATFSLACGEPAVFDGRIWVGGTDQATVDYFRWRQTDATRCALNGWCYWTLRNEGVDYAEATRQMERQSVAAKNELLFARGINFNEVPLWQRRGVGIYPVRVEKEGVNPLTGETVVVTRRQTRVDKELPMGEEYGEFVRARMRTLE
ncbi:MAG: tRNA(His) guanylyltransferase Thg1 family protein [Fimbriimonas sp.]